MKLARICLVVALLGAGSGLTFGQNTPAAPTTVTPPTPSKPDEPPAITTLLALAVIVGAVAAPALLNPKRGHQD